MKAFRWPAKDGMENLQALGGSLSIALGVSRNGSIIVGGAHKSNKKFSAFRWSRENGMIDIGKELENESEAEAVSGNGKVIVGWSKNSNNSRYVFRWSENEGWEAISSAVDESNSSYALSEDSSVVVGVHNSNAFVWTKVKGFEYINIVFSHLSVGGSSINSAFAITTNGRYIVGQGYNSITKRNEAYILDTEF